MYRSVPSLAMAIACALLPLSALAQPPAARQQVSGSQHAGPGQSQQLRIKETFDQDPIEGWEFWCQHAFMPGKKGRALAVNGGGAAVWAGTGEIEDFTMQFRYGYEKGVADVGFHGSESSSSNESYQLILDPEQVRLVRRQHLPDGTFPERQLAAAAASLSPNAWHEVVLRVAAGKIDVWIDDQGVLSFQDPDPLVRGHCSLGAIAGSGFVLYDEIVLVANRPRSRNSLTSDPATWTSNFAGP
jgi:hypothetical protein